MQSDIMAEDSRELIPTRMTLIERLKSWDDQESWREFFETYWKLIYCVAIKAGLSRQDAEDVVQETVVSVSKNITNFKADASYGSFKAWLLRMTRWRVMNRLSRRPPEETFRFHRNRGTISDEAGTATEESLAGPNDQFDAIWDEEWSNNMLLVALDKLKRRVSAKHYQIYYAHVIQDMPVKKVCKLLGTNIAQVYLIKHRLSPLLKKALCEVESVGL